MTKFFRVAIALLAGLAAAGASYQAIANRRDAKRYPEPGRLVDIGGRSIQLNCVGTGSPTVVLEAGLGDNILEWERLQAEVAKFTRVCAYDRAGYGGSDAGPMPRTSQRIAEELHLLLGSAGEKPPYLLAASSFGGYNVRVFNGLYPEEVTGLVLADCVQEDQYDMLPVWWNGTGKALLARYQRQARWAPVYIGMGVAQVWGLWQGIHYKAGHLVLQTKFVKARASELESIRISAEQARSAAHMEDKPLIVLTAGKSDPSLSNSREDFHRAWVEELQPRLARLSKLGRMAVLLDSGHDIPNERPDAIVDAVRELAYSTPKARSTLPQAPVKRP